MVGEALLIFVGITAAIWFENGNDNRRERAVETEIIRSLMVDLQSDTTDLNGNVVALNLFLASADTAAVEDRFVVRVRDQILQPHMIEKSTFDMDLAIETDSWP